MGLVATSQESVGDRRRRRRCHDYQRGRIQPYRRGSRPHDTCRHGAAVRPGLLVQHFDGRAGSERDDRGIAQRRCAIDIYEYPGPIVEATILQTGRLWRREGSVFSSATGFPEAGRANVSNRLDPDVMLLLGQYRKLSLGV